MFGILTTCAGALALFLTLLFMDEVRQILRRPNRKTLAALFTLLAGISTAAYAASEVIRQDLRILGRLFITRQLVEIPQLLTVDSDGAGTAAVFTLQPTSSVVLITCNDSDGCAGTLAEASDVSPGQKLTVINISASNVVTFADSAGVQELTALATLATTESVEFTYASTAWIESGRVVGADAVGANELADTLDLDADLTVTMGPGEQVKFNKAATDAVSDNGVEINYTASDTTSGTTAQYALTITNLTSTQSADALITLDNGDASHNVGAAVRLLNPSRFTAYLDAVGAFVMGTATVTSWTFVTDGTGDGEMVLPLSSIGAGEIVNITRSIPLPLNSWFDGTSRAMLSVDDGADAQPDITLVSSVPRILYDVTGGSPDTNEICTSFTIPADYASGGTIVGRIKQAAATVTQVETFSCRASLDDGAISVANAANLTNVTSVQTATSTPAITWAAGSTVSVCCKQGNASADDAVAILSIEGQYVAIE